VSALASVRKRGRKKFTVHHIAGESSFAITQLTLPNTHFKVSRFDLRGLGLAIGLAIIFLVLSFTRLAGDLHASASFGGPIIKSVLAEPIWSTTLGRNIALFVLALSALHGVFGLICWLLARLSEIALPHAWATRLQWIVLWCVVGALWVLIANAALFPHSSLGEPYAEIVRAGWHGIDLFSLSTALLLAAVGTLSVRAAIHLPLMQLRSRAYVAVGLLVLGAMANFGAKGFLLAPASAATADRPHVIVIGIDSLRYDVTGANRQPPLAPNVGRFLTNAVSFSDAITPLARTFPAWVSIITGRHPHTTGAVINLLPRKSIHTGDTLADSLRRSGYRAVYAIDEVRFSNLDESYGFDEIITPPIGATDFILGWFGDSPLSNLVINSSLGVVLFPNLYANRAAAITYDPDEFVSRLDRRLRFDTPTFLAVHLTLAHWPYSWADSPKTERSTIEGIERYPAAVQRVDHQFQDVMTMLERHGALKNALVIVLSDHGEALGEPEDFLLAQDRELGDSSQSYQKFGHGTSVLSPHQYQVVLGIQAFGSSAIRLRGATVIDAPVSLEDVTPTIVDLLGIKVRQAFDGRSLVPLLRSEDGSGAEEAFQHRIRFTETEFNPRGVMLGTAISTSGIEAAAAFYRVDPITDRIEMKADRVADALQNRQFAAFLPNKLLAAVPRTTVAGFGLISVDRARHSAQRLDVYPSAERDPELAELWAALNARFATH
jgi:Sulfatase